MEDGPGNFETLLYYVLSDFQGRKLHKSYKESGRSLVKKTSFFVGHTLLVSHQGGISKTNEQRLSTTKIYPSLYRQPLGLPPDS